MDFSPSSSLFIYLPTNLLLRAPDLTTSMATTKAVLHGTDFHNAVLNLNYANTFRSQETRVTWAISAWSLHFQIDTLHFVDEWQSPPQPLTMADPNTKPIMLTTSLNFPFSVKALWYVGPTGSRVCTLLAVIPRHQRSVSTYASSDFSHSEYQHCLSTTSTGLI